MPIKEKIILVLKENPSTFEELRKKTKLPKSTVSVYLSKLENEKCIERKRVPRKKRKGKQRRYERRYEILIQLSPKFFAPAETVLRSLKSVVPKLDVERGRELLTDDVVEVVLKIAAKDWDPVERKFDESDFIVKGKLDESILIIGLARYSFEASVPGEIKSLERIESGKLIVDKRTPFESFIFECAEEYRMAPSKLLEDFYRRAKCRNVFPALTEAKDNGVTERLGALLDWLSPCLSPKFKPSDLKAWLKFEAAPNLVASMFRWAHETYVREHIIPAWSFALEKYMEKGR